MENIRKEKGENDRCLMAEGFQPDYPLADSLNKIRIKSTLLTIKELKLE